MKIRRMVLGELDPAERSRLIGRVQSDLRTLEPVVREIIDDVRERGDEALVDYARRFDGVELAAGSLLATEAEFARAETEIDAELRAAITQAVANVRAHHTVQMPTKTWMTQPSPGVLTGERITPIESVGLYVPRGKGSFPSVMMMLCVPAVLAGVPTVVVCTPPGPDGSVDAASLFTAKLCGVDRVFKVGGAQAIAALAHGTASVPKVRKIIGPGNQYVAVAKRLVYGAVDPGPPAGPSESVVLCDAEADPEVAARELLVEAEHGPDSAVLLVTPSAQLADDVCNLMTKLVVDLPSPRREYCERVFSGYGGVVLTSDLAQAVDFVNEYAPEHLRVLVEDPFTLLYEIRNAGEVLLGENASIPYGNFALGVNAILPTGGNAHAYSCVGVFEFVKRSSFAYVSPAGARAMGPIAAALADYEGFPAHANAARYTAQRHREV